MTDIYGLTNEKLAGIMVSLGEKPSKSDIIFGEIYVKLADSPEKLEIRDELKKKIAENFSFDLPECIDTIRSDTADKYLFGLNDGSTVETVLMKHEYGSSVCVSTQVGCNMGCAFCRSGRMKKKRDLTAGEMTGQVMYILRVLKQDISGIAVMGIGEPLDNAGNVSDFIKIMTDPKGLALGVRHITLSTCGLCDKIYSLADSGLRVNLAVSLHAADNTLRSSIMPINKKYPIEEVISAAKYYSERLNRRVTLEYVMLDGVNDSTAQAEKLAKLIGNAKLYVNIIRYNPSKDDSFECSSFDNIMKFYDVLKKNNIGVTMRRSLGGSVDAGCGQLRAGKLS